MNVTDSAGFVVSLNVGLAKEVESNGRIVRTGIFKSSIADRTPVGKTGFHGDEQADLRVHGGPNKAVYGYASEHYQYWREKLGLAELPGGAFGENLTLSGLTEENLNIGDRYAVGSAVLQVAQPRMPCFKLALRFGRADMVKMFWKSGFSGVYFSVVREGEIGPGDACTLAGSDENKVSISNILQLYTGEVWDSGLRERALRTPLRGSWKQEIQERLSEGA